MNTTTMERQECAEKVRAYSDLLDKIACHFMRTTIPTVLTDQSGEDSLLFTNRIDFYRGSHIIEDVPRAKVVEYLVTGVWFDDKGEQV